jgi:hypothetical protein
MAMLRFVVREIVRGFVRVLEAAGLTFSTIGGRITARSS